MGTGFPSRVRSVAGQRHGRPAPGNSQASMPTGARSPSLDHAEGGARDGRAAERGLAAAGPAADRPDVAGAGRVKPVRRAPRTRRLGAARTHRSPQGASAPPRKGAAVPAPQVPPPVGPRRTVRAPGRGPRRVPRGDTPPARHPHRRRARWPRPGPAAPTQPRPRRRAHRPGPRPVPLTFPATRPSRTMPNLKSVMARPALGRRRRSLGRCRAGAGPRRAERAGRAGGQGSGRAAGRDEAGPGPGRLSRRLEPAGPATRRRCRRAHHRERRRGRGAARTHPRPPPPGQ